MPVTRMPPDFDYDTAASRASAFVYGNILVLAALVALSPDRIGAGVGMAVVLGTGLTTFLAHLVGEIVADRIRHDEGPSWPRLRTHMRNSAPIASSAAIPAAVLGAAWIGWLPAYLALAAAQAITIGRVGFLGGLISHYRGEKSVRAIISGIVLAVVCALAAGLKWLLTH